MAELFSQERLQPSLLDRLTDDERDSKQESRERRVLSVRQLKDCVRRDLAWLLNTDCLEEVVDLARFPQVANSVLNYGMPSLTGFTLAHTDKITLERRLRKIICQFEPRIIASSLRVVAELNSAEMSQQALRFEIECDVWAEPIPERMYLKTEVDLEYGSLSYCDS